MGQEAGNHRMGHAGRTRQKTAGPRSAALQNRHGMELTTYQQTSLLHPKTVHLLSSRGFYTTHARQEIS